MNSAFMTVIVNMISLWILDVLMPGIRFDSYSQLFWTAVVLGLLNAYLKPVLKVLSFPITVITLGLFTLVINGFVLRTALSLGAGVSQSLFSSMITAVVLSFVNSLVSGFTEKE